VVAITLALATLALCFSTASAQEAPPAETPSPAAETPALQESTPTAEAPSPTLAVAQQPLIALDIRKTLLGSDIVQVGQLLTFTVRITNTGTVTITTLPLVDEYEPTILQPVPSLTQPPPATTDTAAGVLRWPDLTESFGRDLAPGQSVTVVTVFRAIRIDDEVINRARVEAAIGSGGETGGGARGEDRGVVEGGRVTVMKTLADQTVRADAPVVTFTLTLRNDGFAALVRAPVRDVFRSDLLRFRSSSPPPTSFDPATGALSWDDAIAAVGRSRLLPGETITITSVFALLGPVEDVVVNRGAAVDVRDEFGNAVQSPREAEVRIRLRGPASGTATTLLPYPLPETPAPAEEPRRERTTEPTATAPGVTPEPTTPLAATPVATPAIIPTTTPTVAVAGVVPAQLPRTGAGEERTAWLVAGLTLLALGAQLARRRRG
jgi:LPXTG-motif cell wall-anchored protein